MSSSDDALHEQREWLRVTLSSIGDAVITTDTADNVTFLNPVAQSLTGWTQDEAAGIPLETVFKIIDEDSRQTVENPAARALREGLVVGLANHTLLISKDGTERPIDDSAAPIRNAKGEVAGVVLVFRDITERRRQERSVRDALAYAENIIATLREPFVVLTKRLRVKSANRRFYETFKTSPEETENRLIYELGDHQWDIPKLRELLKEVLNDDHPIHDFEVEQTFPIIGQKIMLLNALRIREPGNQSELILLAIEDVSDRKHADKALEASETRYRRLFETAQDAILILNAETGEILDANPFIRDLLGYEGNEFIGKELWEIGFFKDKSASQAAFRELQDKGYVRFDHLPLETRDGGAIEVEFVSNVYDVDHRRVVQCNIRDISERARLERQTKEQAAELVDLHRRKDEFLAMLSHELRNPLAPIVSAVQILRLQKGENTLQQQAREVIERQVNQLSSLVNDLLEVSRIITGRIQLHAERLDFRGIVEFSVEVVRPLIDKRGHELSVSLPDEPIWLKGDAVRLEQVVVNLLNNAAKYTQEGGRIWLIVRQEGNDMVLRVRDTGVGIPPELLPHVFDLFTQANRTLDRSQGGLGIGLSLVQRLVSLHRGKVEAHSEGLKQGSEFIVRLPLLPTQEKEPSIASSETIKQAAQSWRVLVVDDNEDAADMMAVAIQLCGHQVQVAYSGERALELAVEYQPDFVLLDIGLPGIDGYEIARRLRQLPELENVRLIAATGYGLGFDRQSTLQAGFDHHMVKPIELEKLQTVFELLARLPRSSK